MRFGLLTFAACIGACLAASAETFETTAIQSRIDAAAMAGGGTVTVGKGDHYVGSLELKSGVTLELAEGCRLVASTNYLDYSTDKGRSRSVIWSSGATNVALVGKGEIDGRGWAAVMKDGSPQRWKICLFYRTKGVRMEGVTLRDAASWTCYFKECEDVHANRVTIRSLVNHNNDGFDIDAKNVLIENCDVDSDDDAICPKSDNPHFICENVEVRNCRLASNCNHIKLGTASRGGFRNIRIHHCELVPCSTNIIPQIKNRLGKGNDIPGWDKREIGSRCGIAVECVDGGILENVRISDIKMNRSCQTPIFVRLGRRREHPEGTASCLKDVVIENVTGESMSHLASSITGVPGLRPQNVTIRNVNLVLKGGGTIRESSRPVPEAEKKYPENRMFGRHMLPAYGFYVRHADGVRFENVKLSYTGAAEERPPVVTDDATGVTKVNCDFRPPVVAPGGTDVVEVPVEISNPGFEEGKAGWNFMPNMSVSADRPHGGKACALVDQTKVNGAYVYLTRQVPVDAGAEYGAECFIRTEDVKADDRIRQGSCGATLIVEWCNADKKWIAAGQYVGHFYGTKDWTKVRADQLKAPPDAGYATVYLALRGSGKAWFDDVRFFKRMVPTEKTEPADGATLTTNTPRFGWKYRPGARRFSVVLSQDPGFPKDASVVCPAGGFYDYRHETPLAPGTWYWKVVSKGQDADAAWSFTIPDATAGKDTLAPRLLTRAKRVTSGREAFSVRLRERNGVPKATFLGVPGVCTEMADGEYRCRFEAPADGWPQGFTESVIKVVDPAGNGAGHAFYFLNAPKPENAVVVGTDGMFHEKGRRIFPLGIYEVSPKYMTEVRERGYDVVHTYRWEGSQDDAACRAYLDACWAHGGLRAFIGFDRGNYGPKDGVKQGNFAHTARRVGHLADHPAMFCWYLFDEPEIFGQFTTPDVLVTHADIVRALDPFHPVVMSTWDRNMGEHRRTWDTHWSQAYGKPAEVVSLIDSQRAYIGCSSPITMLLNCNDGAQTGAVRRKEKVDPLHTKFQRDRDWFRACAHLAIVKETNGIWWWWFARDCKDYVTAAQVPQAWEDLTSVNREIIALRPLIAAEGPVTTGRAVDGKFLVEWWAKTVDGRLNAIVVNTAEKPVSVDIDLPLVGRRHYNLGRFEVRYVAE